MPPVTPGVTTLAPWPTLFPRLMITPTLGRFPSGTQPPDEPSPGPGNLWLWVVETGVHEPGFTRRVPSRNFREVLGSFHRHRASPAFGRHGQRRGHRVVRMRDVVMIWSACLAKHVFRVCYASRVFCDEFVAVSSGLGRVMSFLRAPTGAEGRVVNRENDSLNELGLWEHVVYNFFFS